jgi:hypothetical protein
MQLTRSAGKAKGPVGLTCGGDAALKAHPPCANMVNRTRVLSLKTRNYMQSSVFKCSAREYYSGGATGWI